MQYGSAEVHVSQSDAASQSFVAASCALYLAHPSSSVKQPTSCTMQLSWHSPSCHARPPLTHSEQSVGFRGAGEGGGEVASGITTQCAAEEKPSAPPSAPPVDASRRKVRHNLTERRRVDRMNQLFHQLALAICDEPAAPAITMAAMDDAERLLTAEGQELAKPKWSKADVLEGALNVVHDLRRQLAEERIARSLGVPADVELTAPDFAPSDAGLGASSADLDAISADLEAISAEEMADAADSYSSFTAASTSVSSSVHSFGYDPLGLPLSQLMDV